MPESVDAISARILAAPAPVLIPDTCAILDAIRSVFRFSIQGDVMPAAKRLTARARFSPASLWIVVPEQVRREWNDNCQNVRGELSGVIEQADQQSERLSAAAAYLFPAKRMSRLLLPAELDEQVFSVAQEFIDAAQVVEERSDCIEKAHVRVVQRGLRPVEPSSSIRTAWLSNTVWRCASRCGQRAFWSGYCLSRQTRKTMGNP